MKSRRIRPVNMLNLQSGIEYLFKHFREQNMPAEGEWDFHNSLYEELTHERRSGLDVTFWQFLV